MCTQDWYATKDGNIVNLSRANQIVIVQNYDPNKKEYVVCVLFDSWEATIAEYESFDDATNEIEAIRTRHHTPSRLAMEQD